MKKVKKKKKKKKKKKYLLFEVHEWVYCESTIWVVVKLYHQRSWIYPIENGRIGQQIQPH